MSDDTELLRRYAEKHDEAAFAALVQRHVNLVYAAALRRVGADAHLAEEVAQTVFTTLARKAGELANHPALIGWLHRSTQYAAIDALRTKRRQEQRGQLLSMNDEIERNGRGEGVWEEVRPVIDAVLDQLNDRDRGALLLRFFEGQSFLEIGATLSVSEDAARMRVERALEKFRGLLARRGVTSTSAALGVALASQPAIAAPAGFAAAVTSAALAGGAGTVAAWGVIFTMSKIKFGIVSAIVVAALVPAVVEVRANRVLKSGLAATRDAGDELARLQRETARLNMELAHLAAKNPGVDELARLRQRAAQLRARPPGVVDSEMKAASGWRNVGRSTPEAANETFHWAMFRGDVDTVTRLILFEDDTKESRAAFLAKFSEPVRARFPTPERILAAALFGVAENGPRSHDARDSFQLLDVRPDDRPGLMRTRVWYELASGRAWEGLGRWQPSPEGWALQPHSLVKGLDYMVGRFNPATGELLPRPEPPAEK